MNKIFGRIPSNTAALYERTVANVRTRVLTAIPADASDEIRAYTTETVLEIIFRDWHEHGNDAELTTQDWNDLESFAKMAVALAGKQLSTQNKPIFQSTLRALLEDWLDNWNLEGTEGPLGLKARTKLNQAK